MNSSARYTIAVVGELKEGVALAAVMLAHEVPESSCMSSVGHEGGFLP